MIDASLMLFLSDINECRTGENDCSKYVKCVNSPGSFSCVCSCIMSESITIAIKSSQYESKFG